jgi:quercetin dioxygenase-like cupin family protein
MADPKAERKAVFSTNVQLPPNVHSFEGKGAEKTPDTADPIKRIIYMDDRIVPGSFYVEAVWVVGSVPQVHPVHYHDHDEIVGFVGSNMNDLGDLGAEIDFIIDGEKTTITKTCFIYVPAGVKHGGLCFRKIDRPVFQIAMLRHDIYASVPPT